MFFPFLIIIVSTYFIWKISESFDESATYLTRNLSEGLKGPTINAIARASPASSQPSEPSQAAEVCS